MRCISQICYVSRPDPAFPRFSLREKTYLSAARWDETRRLLPEMTVLDCTEMMAQVRWIKTPDKIQFI
ncbi:MAG: hypothetical protein OEU26_02265 [Candidatus Tectomicrobia bacterium]|nr:hypothetical protein [Candidatus Tectomicrobia bacterium]